MARQKKKTTRRLRKQKRREAMARARKERGWEAPQGPTIQRDEMDKDLFPLLPLLRDDSGASAPALAQPMSILVESEGLAAEPEFETIMVSPMLCVDTFIKAGKEHGIEPESLSKRPEHERDSVYWELLAITIQRLLSETLRQDIVNGLGELRARCEGLGRRKEAVQAGALQSYLSQEPGSEMWAMLGLVQAIFHRSLHAGFEMLEATVFTGELETPDKADLPLAQKLAQSRGSQKADAALEKVPGLSRYLEKQADATWVEGSDALLKGHLNLGLFSPEELATGLDIVRATSKAILEDRLAEKATGQGPITLEVASEDEEALVSRFRSYLTELFTPERLDHLRARLDSEWRTLTPGNKWRPFVFLLASHVADPGTARQVKGSLTLAFMGEMRAQSTPAHGSEVEFDSRSSAASRQSAGEAESP